MKDAEQKGGPSERVIEGDGEEGDCGIKPIGKCGLKHLIASIPPEPGLGRHIRHTRAGIVLSGGAQDEVLGEAGYYDPSMYAVRASS